MTDYKPAQCHTGFVLIRALVMKKLLIGFLGGVVLFTSTIINADKFGAADDTYIRFQVKIPFAAKRLSLFSNHNEYSAILINQVDGFKNGLVFTRYTNGSQTLGYVLSDITLPLVIQDRKGVNQSNMNGGTTVLGAVIGAAAIIAIAKKAAEEVTESVVETALEVIDNHDNN